MARLGTCTRCGGPTGKPANRRCRRCFYAVRRMVIRRSSPPPTPQPTQCRIWQGVVDVDGYGLRENRRLHRWVWEQVHGPLSPDMFVMHLCDNPPCYRLDHLRAGTHLDNMADMRAKGRASTVGARGLDGTGRQYHPVGELHPMCKLTAEQVVEMRQRIAAGETQSRLAAEYGVSPATITLIKQGKLWAHLLPNCPGGWPL